MSRYIAKYMNLEMLKRLTFWNGGSTEKDYGGHMQEGGKGERQGLSQRAWEAPSLGGGGWLAW